MTVSPLLTFIDGEALWLVLFGTTSLDDDD
jgi:hypothetical protein